MKVAAGRKNSAAVCGIRTVNDVNLRTARAITVSRGLSPGQFSVYLESKSGERIRVSDDLTFRSANEVKERYLQRRFFLNQAST